MADGKHNRNDPFSRFRINLNGVSIEKSFDIVQIFCYHILKIHTAYTKHRRDKKKANTLFLVYIFYALNVLHAFAVRQRKVRRIKGEDNKEYYIFFCSQFTSYVYLYVSAYGCVSDLSLLSTYIR